MSAKLLAALATVLVMETIEGAHHAARIALASEPPATGLDVERLRFAKALTEYGVHHGNCPLDSWNLSQRRCKCGLFALIKQADAALGEPR